MTMDFLLISGVCMLMISLAHGAPCTAGAYVGDDTPLTRNTRDFNQVGMSLWTDHAVTCDCGVIYQWIYHAQVVDIVFFQVWRDVGGTYELIGQHQTTPTATGDNTDTFADGIPVLAGDIVGWYSPGNSVVSYKINGGGPNFKTSTTVGAVAVGGTYPWTEGTTMDRRFGFQAVISPNAAPVITNAVMSTTIMDISPTGFVTYVFEVFDADGDPVTASMQTASTEFAFDPNTLTVTTSINTLTPNNYPLTFQVQDPCGAQTTRVLTITVTDSPIYITNLPNYVIVSQDLTAQTLLHSITTSDASPVDSVTSCTLAAAPEFTIIQTGATYEINNILNPGFDYVTTKKYEFDVTCSDAYGSSDTETFYVYVISNVPPVFTNLPAKTTIARDIAIGTSLFTVTATDADVNDVITFNPPTCSTAICPFTITALGEIQTSQDISMLTNPGYNVYVTISDGTNTVGPMSLTVIVTGINSGPVIQTAPLTFSLSFMENIAKGTSIYLVSAADTDLDPLTYSATFTPAGEGASVFSFDTTTGLLSTSTTNTIDYEGLASKSFTVDVSVTDGEDTDSYPTFTVNVIDINEPPAFGNTIYYINGNEGNAGENFGNPGFTVTDQDTGDTHTYSVDCPAIAMNPNTADVTLSDIYDLDIAGTASVLTCIATVSDGEYTDTTQLIVTINDVNDHVPTFGELDYTIFTNIYSNVGDIIGNIEATDGDLGIYGAISYSLDTSGLNGADFGVSGTGNIFLNRPLSTYGDGGYFPFTATVTDYGGLTSTANVAVVVYTTTTIPTTTTTERYITFFEYPPNIPWFVFFWLTAIGMAATFAYLMYTRRFLRDLTCEDFKSACRREKKKRIVKVKHRNKSYNLASGQKGVRFVSPNQITTKL
ncbi:cadherin EGF LAG seven-pass G-type receptor 2-like [Argopecten irradians]|uniref:cadherin EGF LAG seven-pass G-type receptor 2-like n=1 Tax=Argopecten irradians TaxID=31199 RepID=UPI0037129431